jgi:hypothetical protein
MKYKQLDKAKEARRRARKVAVKGLHQRVILDKRLKPEKHKKPFDWSE